MRVKHDSSACICRKQGGTADYDSVPFQGWGLFLLYRKLPRNVPVTQKIFTSQNIFQDTSRDTAI